MRDALKHFIIPTLALVLSSCLDPCGTTLLSEVLSPDGRNKAAVFLFGCGATTSDTLCVAIIPAKAPMPRSGNIFEAEYREPVSVRWENDSHLVVTGQTDSDVQHKTVVFHGITISYEAKASTSTPSR